MLFSTLNVIYVKEAELPSLHSAQNAFKNSDRSKINHNESEWCILLKLTLVSSIRLAMQTD